jgi:hypothetical protein
MMWLGSVDSSTSVWTFQVGELVNITARPWGLPELATRVRESQDVDDDDFDIFLKSYKKH